MEYLEHTTKEGERWDQLAVKYYGDPFLKVAIDGTEKNVMTLLREENDVVNYERFPANVVLKIPIVEQITVTTDYSKQPPWKQ